MTRINLTVDGMKVSDDVEPRMLLVQYLREKLGKTGTVIGCDTSNCGACTVHLDGESVKSCNVLAVQADGRAVTTIEGLASNGELHPVQEAFRECHGLQCGFCTPLFLNAVPHSTGLSLSASVARRIAVSSSSTVNSPSSRNFSMIWSSASASVSSSFSRYSAACSASSAGISSTT